MLFPEDVWKLIKKFYISKEAKWLYVMRNGDIFGLRSFLYSITLSKKYIEKVEINKLKGQIVNCLYKSPEHANLLKEGVQAGISNCLKYLRVGEEVLVFCMDSAEDTESFECYRKGVVRKINPLRIALYNFELLIREPRNVDDMIWLDTFDKEIIVSKEELFCIKQKGFLYQMHTLARSHISKVFDDEFKIGKRKFHRLKM
jgi:hypothetical protein